MKRLLVALIVAAAGLSAPATSAAATTYHGTVGDASGYKLATTLSPVAGTFALETGGNWSILRGSDRTEIQGLLPVSGSCKAWLPPCPFSISLAQVKWQPGTWHNEAYSSDGVLPHGAVTFYMDLRFKSGTLDLHVEITGCPYGWQYWDYVGAD